MEINKEDLYDYVIAKLRDGPKKSEWDKHKMGYI